MKKFALLAVLATLLFSCKKDSDDTGIITVNVSYQVSSSQGSKADAGASVYLYKQTGKEFNRVYIDYKIGYLTDKSTGETVRPDYSATADASGNAVLNNIPYGKYLIVASSKGRNVYSAKPIDVNSPNQSLVKNFGSLNDYKDEGEAW